MSDLQRTATAFELLLKEIVDKPDLLKLEIEAADGNGPVTFRVGVAPSDIGRLIGMQGRTARALRIILGSISGTLGRRLNLDIVERT